MCDSDRPCAPFSADKDGIGARGEELAIFNFDRENRPQRDSIRGGAASAARGKIWRRAKKIERAHYTNAPPSWDDIFCTKILSMEFKPPDQL